MKPEKALLHVAISDASSSEGAASYAESVFHMSAFSDEATLASNVMKPFRFAQR
jgi:hypothetical protein